MNAHETTEIRTLADSVLDEVSGGGEAGYRDGHLHLDFGAGAAGLMPGNGGVRYIDDALGTGIRTGA